MKTYLFSYPFRDGRYSLEVPAESEPEAKARVLAMSRAEFDGTVAMTIPVPGGGWLSKMLGIR